MKYQSIIINSFFIILLSISSYNNAWSKAGKDHAGDMVEVLIGKRNAIAPDLRKMCKRVSSTIDNFDVIKGIPLGETGHRAYGHWGFSGSIPFNKEPLKGILENIEKKWGRVARDTAKQKIIDAWKKDVRKMIQLVETETGLVGRQAKGLAGLFYDIHILGDWTGDKLNALQAADDLGKDAIKNLHRLLGNNSHLVNKIEEEVKKTIKFCLGDGKCKAKAILDILKNSDELRIKISTLISDKYPIFSKVITSKPMWKVALTLSALSSRYNSLMKKIPDKYRTSAQAGIITGIVSTGIYGYQVIQGDLDPFEAASKVAENSVLSAGSVYISDAILVKMGDKYALQTLAKSGSTLCKAFGTAVNLGIATFIFDETRIIYNFSKGDINEKQFFQETGKAVLKTGGSFGATYCAVAINLSPTGPVVMFIAVGGYLLADQAISYAEKLNKRNYLFIEDVLGHLPLEMQRRVTPWDRKDVIIPWDRANTITPWDKQETQTPWENNKNISAWD